ncbi:MrcB family domain-containing protein [Methanobrevibacter sp.]|uniref:MrcB family domain-containing protein n=1 Tax=Methanobrevibacter sp. TaxID=66852 RepID=UPI00388CF1FC
MISRVFREILDVYETQKTKEFKGNPFVLKFQDEVPAVVVNNIEDSFTVRASCGHNAWADRPWINIIHRRYDNHHEALVIEYRFDSENSEVHLSLVPRLEDYSQYVSVKEKLRNILKKLDVYSFEVPDEESFSILTKKYVYDDLGNFALVSDLEYMINIHEKLVPYFSAFLKEETYDVDILSCGVLYDMECSKSLKLSVSDIRADYTKKTPYIDSINDPQTLFTDKTIRFIQHSKITYDDYSEILAKIRDDYRKNLDKILEDHDLRLSHLTIKEKVLLLSKSFVKTGYKSVGRQLGNYSFDEIRVDDRPSDALIITSIIHELSHFLLEKILKELFMKILKTNDTPLISAFIKIMLEDNELNYIMDEFCAHTVEGRFALYGYQDYSSFKYKLDEISHLYSKDDIDYTLIVANSFAYDIKDILEDFLNEDLRAEIKEEFSDISDDPDYDELDFEIETRLVDKDLMEEVKFILTGGFRDSASQMDKLERYMAKYENLFL